MKFNDLIKMLEQYMHLLEVEGAPANSYKIRAYVAIARKLQEFYPNASKNPDLNLDEYYDNMRGRLTKESLNKLGEVIRTRHFLKLEDLERRIEYNVKVVRELMKVNGVGEVLAKELVGRGIRSKKDLEDKNIFALLPKIVQHSIMYKPLESIPAAMITSMLAAIKKQMPKAQIEVVGSYRRGSKTSSDIDFLIVGSEKDVEKFINESKSPKFLEPYASGATKVSSIVVFDKKNVKVDVFRTEPAEYIYALLFTTGGRDFNIGLRRVAMRRGLLLNHKGLFDKKTRKQVPGIKTEQDIFKALGVKYVAPTGRTSFKAVEVTTPFAKSDKPASKSAAKGTSSKGTSRGTSAKGTSAKGTSAKGTSRGTSAKGTSRGTSAKGTSSKGTSRGTSAKGTSRGTSSKKPAAKKPAAKKPAAKKPAAKKPAKK
jgi:DNA polymerase/3'-5' exonuclease PolX